MLPIQHVHGILDRSGSMNGKTDDVIGGFKSNIANLREDKSFDIRISAKMFDHEDTVLLRSTPVNDLTEEQLDDALRSYIPRGQTALRDALGNSLVTFMNIYNITPFQSCMIYVMTDGLENSSSNHLFYPEQLKELIQRAEIECNIKVFYVGSNQDAILNAAQIGIAVGQAINFVDTEEANVQAAFRSLSSVAARMRSNEVPDFVDAERAASSRQPEPYEPPIPEVPAIRRSNSMMM